MLLAVLAAVPAALGLSIALAAITDAKGSTHSYGGFSCQWGGASQLASAGGSTGGSSTAIFTSSCTNGYRELYTEALTATNGYYWHYSDWQTSDQAWNYYGRSDLCQIWGEHRMSKAGVDTSTRLYTYVVGCEPV